MIYLSLFSGVGGGDLAAQHMLGWRACAYVEWDPYCQEVLRARQQDGWLDVAPVFGDVRSFVGDGFASELSGMVDVVLAGFPCQPFSVAGKQQGEDDPRNMWPATRDVLRVVRPRHALLENVAGLLAHPYWTTIMSDLAEIGYDARWACVRASDAGAPHRRERVFVWCDSTGGSNRRVADAESVGREAMHPAVADADGARPQGHRGPLRSAGQQSATEGGAGSGSGWWDIDPADRSTESRVGRVADGVARRVDRLKACGNGIVPHQLALAWRVLTGA